MVVNSPGRSARRAAVLLVGALLAWPVTALSQAPDTATTRPAPASASADGAPGGGSAAVVTRVRALLDADMPVTASRTIARELSLAVVEGADAVLLAARANAMQRSWGVVRRLLAGRPWPDAESAAEARLLLARAYAGLDSAGRTVETYTAYLSDADGPPPVYLRVDLARAYARLDRNREAIAQLVAAEKENPAIGRWLRLSRLEALAGLNDTTLFALADSLAGDPLVAADSILLPAARLAFELGDGARAMRLVERAGPGVRRSLAEEHIAAYLLASGDTAAAVDTYREAVETGSARAETGPALLEHDRSWRTLASVGRSDARAGRRSRAADYLREALEAAPGAERPAIAETLAGVYRALGEDRRALEVISPWLASRDPGAEGQASLWLLAARAYASLGEADASDSAYARAARGVGSAAALAAYLIADARQDEGRVEEAESAFLRAYTRFPGSSYGERALERVALLEYRAGRYATARVRLEDYRRRYPTGDWAQGALFWTGKTLEAEGDTAMAHGVYLRTIAYNPLDYYAILASRRVGADRWAALHLVDAGPLPALAPVYADALDRMNLLRDLGWVPRARREFRRARELGPGGNLEVLAFAHALDATGWTQEGVSEGWRAKARQQGWTRLHLQAIYPFPFSEALTHAARERGLPVYFVAGLARRESLFDPDISSGANAIGLMQLLPATARDVAPRAGLPEYQRAQLTVPQVNLLLGTRYLADLLERFDGDPVAGMISYNAGPHRYLRWREFPEFADDEMRVERIPFKETREYVRAVTELGEIYRFLYPDAGRDIP